MLAPERRAEVVQVLLHPLGRSIPNPPFPRDKLRRPGRLFITWIRHPEKYGGHPKAKSYTAASSTIEDIPEDETKRKPAPVRPLRGKHYRARWCWVSSSRRLRAELAKSRATALIVFDVESVAGTSSGSGVRRRTAARSSSPVRAS